jgi:hypothetical protein
MDPAVPAQPEATPPPPPPPPPSEAQAAPAPAPGHAPEQPPPHAPEHPHAELGFWQLPWVQNFLPLGTSIVIHIVVIVVGLMLVVPQIKYREVSQEQFIVPEAAMIENAPVGGIPNPGLGGDPNRSAAQEQFDTNASDGFAQKPSETLAQSLMGGGVADSASDNTIAVGPNVGFGKGAGAGSGIGETVGSGEGEGGALAPFGVAGGGGGAGPKSPFMGISGNATRVAYVCDASGSMIEKMSPLKNELKKAIDVLKPVQGFSVIFFSDPDQKPKALAQTMLMASPDNKRKAYDFLENVTAAGSTDPIPGLELALKGRPQLIYLLTDGDFPDNDAVIKRLKELNKGIGAKINTIAFVSGRDKAADQSFEKVLKQIADDSHGIFKHVSVQDVQ